MKIRYKIKNLLLKLLCLYPYKIDYYSNINFLKEKGLEIGENFSVQHGCIIDDNHCWMIKIGDNVTLAPNVHILAHDASTKNKLGYTIVKPVNIGNNVFIGAGSIILPGVDIGNDVIIGAGSIVTKNIPNNSVFCGDKVIKSYEEFISQKEKEIKKCKEEDRLYSQEYTYEHGITETLKKEMKAKNGGYVE